MHEFSKPPVYLPSQLMKKFVDPLGSTVHDFTTAVAEYHPKTIGIETVNGWLNHDQPVSPTHRKAFFKFVRAKHEPQVARRWERDFTECWAQHASIVKPFNSLLQKHHKWIAERYKRPMFGETFPLADVYVPLKLTAYGMRSGLEELDQVFEEKDLIKFAQYGFRDSERTVDKNADWLFIKGGPGSGKSALALNLANTLSNRKSGAVFFVRGSRLAAAHHKDIPKNPKVLDDAVAPEAFIDLFIKSSKKWLTLIIDGLDEIGTINRQNEAAILDILEGIRQNAELAEGHGKKVRVLVFGRDTLTEIASKAFQGKTRLLEMGDLSGALGRNRLSSHCYDDDRRAEWWSNYAKAKGFGDVDITPKYLTDIHHSLHEIGREPLLAFLIAKSAWPENGDADLTVRQVVDVLDTQTTGKNRNEIYADIVDRVRQGRDWKEDVQITLPLNPFVSVLQHMALATWHNGTMRDVTVAGVKQVIQDPLTKHAFETMLRSLGGDTPSSLLTAFYYRFTERAFEQGVAFDAADYEIEFTHKTFAEYLLTTFLFDQFEGILDLFVNDADPEQRAAAERRFMQLVMAGPQTREIARFFLDEARLRFDNKPWKHWSQARHLMTELQCLNMVDDTEQSPWTRDVSTLSRLQRASLVVMLAWGSLNRTRYEKTEKQTEFDEDADGFESYDVQDLVGSYTLGQFFDGVEMGDAAPDSFVTSALSGVKWAEADVPGIYLSGDEIYGSNFLNCVFEASTWNAIQISKCEFYDSNLRRARFVAATLDHVTINKSSLRQSRSADSFFQSCRLKEVRAEQSEVSETQFLDCEFTDVVLSRSDITKCKFTACRFVDCDFEAALFDDVEFDQCTFSGCRTEDSMFSSAKFKKCSGHESHI